MVKRCVIVAASPDATVDTVRSLVKTGDFVAAADGGYRLAAAAGIVPDLLIGDFDSLSEHPAVETVVLPCHKDETDTAAAIRLCWERGARDFLLIGTAGGRPDHDFANLASMAWIAAHGGTVIAHDRHGVRRMASPGRYTLPRENYTVFSLFAFGGEVTGLSIENAAYPLTGATLRPDFPLGVSNRFADGDAHIAFDSGILLIFCTRD